MFNFDSWVFHRKLAMASMRDFGIGKFSTESRVHEEIEFMCAEILKHEGKPVNCQLLLGNVVSNIISGVVFSRRYVQFAVNPCPAEPAYKRCLQTFGHRWLGA